MSGLGCCIAALRVQQRYNSKGLRCPATVESRLAWTRDGKVVGRFERPWWDGTKLAVFEPPALIERLAAPVPRVQGNLVTCHGAFASGVFRRDRVVPPPPSEGGERPGFRSAQRRRPASVAEKRETKPHWRCRSTLAELMRWLLTLRTDPRTIVRVLP